MKRRVALAVAALVVLTFLGARAFRSLDLAKRVAATCDATDPEEGVTTSDGLVESLEDGDPLLPVAVECRCGALVDAGRGAECAKLITDTIDRAGGAWIDLGVLDRLTNHLLVSKAPLPAGEGYQIVVQAKTSADAKSKNFRIKLETHICKGCSNPEYACTCDE